jgi:hypothetical protein
MSTPARTIMIFGIYVVITGLAFFLLPNMVLPLLGFATTTEVWIRVMGLLGAILGAYYLYCARHEALPFFRATVYGRVAFFIGLTALALRGLGGPMLIVFGLIDLVGAVWTGLSLRASRPSGA